MARPLTRNPTSVRSAGLLSERYGVAGVHIEWMQGILIAIVTLWIYSPAMFGDWLWDDSMYLTQNRLLEQPDRLWKAWFQPGSFVEYYPLQQTLQWFQWQLWDDNPFPYRLTNILLHIVNALLVWRLLGKLGVKLAWIGGLIFAVHPVNVESVAWISEFKNCLSLLPALLAMCAWIDYAKRRNPRDFRLCLAFFVASMLCKISMTMFPLIILLYAWWKRGRIEKEDARASLAFLLISVAAVALAIISTFSYMHHVRQIPAVVSIGGLLPRLALAGTTASFYFAQVFIPWDLLPIYPQWQVNPPSLVELLPWLGFGAALLWLWTKRATWGRHALLGMGFFLINLAPFSGILGISYMSFTWVMDHFLYLPAIGLIGLVAAAIGNLDDYLAARSQVISTAIIALLIGLLVFRAHWYAAAFTNETTLWSYTVKSNPGSWMAQSALGKAVMNEGEPGHAVGYLAAAVAENPDLGELHGDLGDALVQSGQVEAGIVELRRALQIDPYSARANNNLGIVLAREGKTDEAIAHFVTAVRSQPDEPEAYSNLGNTYSLMGQLDLAVNWYEQALKLQPNYPDAIYNLGSVKLRQNKLGEAVADFAEALRLRPDDVRARNNLGAALGQMGRIPQAIEQFRIVLKLDPDNATAKGNLATLLGHAPVPAK